MNRSRKGLALLLLALMTFLAACGGGSSTPAPSGGSSGSSTPPPAAPKEIMLGAIVPLTGPNSAWGQMTWHGFELAGEMINEQGGIKSMGGAKIKTVAADTESKPEVAGTQTQKLIQQGAVALVGTNQSAATLVATQVAERNEVSFITPSDVEPTITQRGFKYTFRTSPLIDAYGKDILSYIKEQGEKSGKKATKVAILSENSVVGQSSVKFAEAAAKQLGFTVVDSITYDAASTQNFATYLSKFKSLGAEVIMGHNKPSDAILITRTLKELNYNPMAYAGMLGGHVSNEYVTAMGKDADNVIATTSWAPSVKIAGMDELAAKFKAKYNADMDSTAAAGFTAMAVLWEALEKGATNDPKKLRDAIAKVELKTGEKMYLQLPGVKFGPTGENTIASGVVFNIQDKKWVPIAPTAFATTTAPWPKPEWGK
jgi:branched-chain amino acid transport system substrate-binding protein